MILLLLGLITHLLERSIEMANMPVVCGASRDGKRKECAYGFWKRILKRRRGASREHLLVKKGSKVYCKSVCIFDTLRVN